MKGTKRAVYITATVMLVFAAVLSFFVVFVTRNINFDADEALFRDADEWGSTVLYASSARATGELDSSYTPVEINLSGNIKKVYYPTGEICDYLKDGFVAVEDRHFYSHGGVDIKRTFKAVLNYLFRSEKLFGASTITQQVVKNISGDNDLSVTRKLSEIIRAVNLEREHTKDEILEVYLNVIPMSENMYGVGAASRGYFGKEPSELSASEAAMLIGITNAPTAYNPYTNPEACLKKRNFVLSVMHTEGVINDVEYNEALASPLGVKPREELFTVDSWFAETVLFDVARDMSRKYGISESAAKIMLLRGGYSIYTTMNIEVQRVLEEYFENTDNLPSELSDGLGYAMAVTDTKTGDLIGIIGNAGEKQGNRLLNHALLPHTPGSVLKPLAIYAPLIEKKKINWATVLDDVPTDFISTGGGYTEYPHNSPNVYSGLITVKDALRLSKNTIAVRLCKMMGEREAYRGLIDNFGFDTLVEREVSEGGTFTDIAVAPMALGQLTRGVSIYKLTEAFGTFASGGIHRAARSYLAVFDHNGEAVLENKREEKRVFSEDTAAIMNKMLMGVTESGTARGMTLPTLVETAGKTGTSGGSRDKMFVGYTPYYTAGIWCGYTSGDGSVSGLSKSHLKIWDEVMTKIHEALDLSDGAERFSEAGLVRRSYCMDSGKIFSDNCIYDVRGSREEYGYFTLDNMPIGLCDRHILCAYDSIGKGVSRGGCPERDLVTVSLLKVFDRHFPCEIYITDAEYVYRDIDGRYEWCSDDDRPYFYYSLPEGEHVGISKRKRQLNSGCPYHK